MNLSRLIAGALSSHARPSTKWLSAHRFPFGALHLASLSDEAAAASAAAPAPAPAKRTLRRVPKSKTEVHPPTLPPSAGAGAQTESSSLDVPRPQEIPFQVKVANQVHLIGSVGLPVKLQTLSDGSLAAVSILTREEDTGLRKFGIPVIFVGDLAQIAASYLKENDSIYITGQLSSDAPPHIIGDATTNIQVVADSLSFVQNLYPGKTLNKMTEKVEPTSVPADNSKKMLNDSVSPSDSRRKMSNFVENMWNDLISNPHNWCDYRAEKLNGSVKPKYPDFKNMQTRKALWLDTAPSWVLQKLDGLEFGTNKPKEIYGDSSRKMSTKQSDNEILWRSLVNDPKNWWDNRPDKPYKDYPDFKHKTTREVLWINSTTPKWILEKLPPMKTEKNVEIFSASATMLS